MFTLYRCVVVSILLCLVLKSFTSFLTAVYFSGQHSGPNLVCSLLLKLVQKEVCSRDHICPAMPSIYYMALLKKRFADLSAP